MCVWPPEQGKVFAAKPERKKPLGRRRWKYNIKKIVRKWSDCMDYINVSQNMDQLCSSVAEW